MVNRLRTHLRSHVIGYLALFVALGGTAVGLPGRAGIDRNDLRKNVVATKNIKPNAATGAKVNEGSLDFTCAGGRLEASGLCWDSANRASDDWTAALADCAAEGGRLPELTELRGARGVLGTPAVYLWTGALWDDGGVFRAATLRLSDNALDGASISSSDAYRCAFPLVAR